MYLKFNEITSFEILNISNSVTCCDNGETNRNGSDVKLSINGTEFNMLYTNTTVRNKLKQIEKYFKTNNEKLKQKTEEYLLWLEMKGYGVSK